MPLRTGRGIALVYLAEMECFGFSWGIGESVTSVRQLAESWMQVCMSPGANVDWFVVFRRVRLDMKSSLDRQVEIFISTHIALILLRDNFRKRSTHIALIFLQDKFRNSVIF